MCGCVDVVTVHMYGARSSKLSGCSSSWMAVSSITALASASAKLPPPHIPAAAQPEVLRAHALHFETKQPIPDELLAKLKAARAFNQGFGTIE